MRNEIDTEIRHTTTTSGNLFADLGFGPEKSALLQDQTDREINAALAFKEQLMAEVSQWIRENHLNQQQAAEILHTTRPRVSDPLNWKVTKFTVDALVNILSRTGRTVRLEVLKQEHA